MPFYRVTRYIDAYVTHDAIICASDREEACLIARNNRYDDSFWSKESNVLEYDETEVSDPNDIEEITEEEAAQIAAGERSEPEPSYTMTIDKRELGAILAGLHLLQAHMVANRLSNTIADIMSDDDTFKPLNDTEIDDLCERING